MGRKEKICKLLLKRLREELMTAAVDEEVLRQEWEQELPHPFPSRGTLQEYHMDLAFNLIRLLKRAGKQKEVDVVLTHYKIDPFFRSERRLEALKKVFSTQR